MSPRLLTKAIVGPLLLAAVGFAGDAPAPRASEAVPPGVAPISTVAEASARWAEATREETPVRLEGVVTGTMPSGAFRLHDGTLGIFVAKSPAGRKLVPGDRVAVSGVLRRDGFSPWVTPHQLEPRGKGAYPEPQPGSYSLLASGAADNQWLEIEGVVRAAEALESRDFIVLDLGMAGGNLRVLLNYSPHPDLASLVDANVRLRGLAAVNVNKHGHVVEPSFRVPSFAELTVTRPAPTDAFALPVVPVDRLLKLPPGEQLRHRVRTGGVVTRRLSDTMFFLREGGLGLKVETQRPVNFHPGDVVEVAGFPEMEEGLAVLQHSIARFARAGPPPSPVMPTLAALLEGTHNSDLVTIRARLADRAVTGPNVTLIFEAEGELFKGLIKQSPGMPLSLPENNSVVNVTGICIISELEDVWFYRPRSFLLLVGGLADLELVQTPPWWTRERLWSALAITGIVLLAAAGWAWSLRRQMERKRAVIEQQARHAAVLEERSRIARDLHDTLEQGLTGLSLQMKAIETDFSGAPHAAQAGLRSARQMLRQSRALAHNAIRELRGETVPPRHEGLLDGLRRVAASWNRSGALTVDVRVAGPVRPLHPRLEDHLLGIGTEAMTNAVKHGRADAIQVEVDFHADEVALRIKDNGTGFDPAAAVGPATGCFGLQGMRERAREVGGAIRIQSRRDHGTEVSVAAPLLPGSDAALPGGARP